jgi:hypothetical protein
LGVWVTLDLTSEGAVLAIYDYAPDVPTRTCLDIHPFPIAETVWPFPEKPPHILQADALRIHR